MAKLGEVCLLKAGKFVSANDISPEYNKGLYPCFGGNGIRGYVADYTHDGEFPLIGRQGALCGNVNLASGKFHATEHAVVVQPKIEMNVHWLYYALNAMNLGQYATGAAQPGLAVSKLETLSIEIPNISEQNKIAQTLYKVEQLVNFRKQQLAKLDELVKARFVEMFGDFEFNSKEFPVYHLCELCDVGSSKRIYQEEQSISGIPFLKVADLNELIDTGKYSCSTFIPLERYEQLLHKELTPTENDILITSRGTLGKCYIVQSDDEFYFQDGMISWLSNFSPKVSSIYISYLFAQPYIQKQIESLQAGSTVAYLSIAMLKKINVILPPKKLQDDFATFVEHVDQQKQTVQQSLEKLELMKKALMQEYFG
jgi:type I restriction enzyme S subunit